MKIFFFLAGLSVISATNRSSLVRLVTTTSQKPLAKPTSVSSDVATTTPKYRHRRISIGYQQIRTQYRTSTHPLSEVSVTPALSRAVFNKNLVKNGTIQEKTPASFQTIGDRYESTLKWSLVRPATNLPVVVQRRALTNAFKRWGEVAAINIIETGPENANIKIRFEKHDHGDGYPFDGKDGILAHAFSPDDGRVHFDDDEAWSVNNPSGGKYLENIATHEFGHALGLKHSSVYNAVMAPYYQGYKNNFKLHEDDIKAIQQLYGARLTTSKATPISSRSLPDVCKLRFDDIVKLPDGRYYIFRKHWIYKLNIYHNQVEETWPKPSHEIYEEFPDAPDAVTYSRKTYRLYAFKANKIWRYYKGKLDKGFPVNMKSSIPAIQTAFAWRMGNIYVIAARQLYLFHESTLSLNQVSSLSGVFSDAPHNPEAAVWDGYSSIYFFRGAKGFRVDDTSRTVLPGSPFSKHEQWLSCSSS